MAPATHSPMKTNFITGWDIFGFVVVGVFVGLLITFFIVCMVKKFKKTKNEQVEIPEEIFQEDSLIDN